MRFRRPIERQRAAGHIFTLLISFAATVLVTRLFLELTGYPQIGNEQLHIAHVLWGGLIVAVGAALPLIFASRYVYGISAVLSGVGLGLFFDEVGKFLTQNNDYFFRPAASVIYVIFLIGVYVYVTVRRGEPDAQVQLHHVLVIMQEVVDADLEEHEKAELRDTLADITRDKSAPHLHALAQTLLDFVQNRADTIPRHSHPIVNGWERVRSWLETRILTRQVTRWLLIASTVILAGVTLIDLVSLVRVIGEPGRMAALVEGWIARGNLTSHQEAVWFAVMIGLNGVVGLALIVALVHFAMGRDETAIDFALAGLLVSITIINVLLFYFQQFVAAGYVAIQFAFIAMLEFYANRHLKRHDALRARS
jgi:hypothetical protein